MTRSPIRHSCAQVGGEGGGSRCTRQARWRNSTGPASPGQLRVQHVQTCAHRNERNGLKFVLHVRCGSNLLRGSRPQAAAGGGAPATSTPDAIEFTPLFLCHENFCIAHPCSLEHPRVGSCWGPRSGDMPEPDPPEVRTTCLSPRSE